MKKLFLALSIITLMASCFVRSEECSEALTLLQYEFRMPIHLSPQKDTFNIGDTITFISEFSDIVLEEQLQKEFELLDWDFYPYIDVGKIDTVPVNRVGFDYFEVLIDTIYKPDTVTFSSGFYLIEARYTYENNMYKFEYQLIPTTSGLYQHNAGLSFGDIDPHQSFEGKCHNKEATGNLRLNAGDGFAEGDANNSKYLLDSPDGDLQIIYEQKDDPIRLNFHKRAGYCFYVR